MSDQQKTVKASPPPRRGPWRTVRGWFRVGMQRDDGWTQLTEKLRVPDSVLDSFAAEHPEAVTRHLGLLDESFWQWVRVVGRFPAGVSQPSVAVHSLRRVFISDRDAWEELPLPVRALPHVEVRGPHSVTSLLDPLHLTYVEAQREEMSSGLPALFRVDESLGIWGGRRYRHACTSECAAEEGQEPEPHPDRICLHGSLFAQVHRGTSFDQGSLGAAGAD